MVLGGKSAGVLTSHQNTWHILIAPGDNHHAIEEMASGSSLHLVSYQVSRLKGIGHPHSTHADAIANADGTKLVANYT